MIDDRVPVEVPTIRFRGRGEPGSVHSCVLSISPQFLAYPATIAGEDNIVQFSTTVEVREVGCDEQLHVFSHTGDSVFLSELRRFEESISELRAGRLSSSHMSTLDGGCCLTLGEYTPSLAGLIKVSTRLVLPMYGGPEVVLREHAWYGNVHVEFHSDQSYLSLAQEEICSVLRHLDELRE